METTTKNGLIYKLLRAAMILFWVYVGMEKLWQLEAFKIALQQQPVIGLFAPVLFWLLPLTEISVGLLLSFPTQRIQGWGWRASILLITVFSIYIGLGVFKVYAKKPCMCTSFLSNISWSTHLLINIALLVISLVGWRFQRSLNSIAPIMGKVHRLMTLLFVFSAVVLVSFCHNRSSYHNEKQNLWFQSDSLTFPAYDSVSRPIVGSLAIRYNRYTGQYRHYLLTKSMQANSMTNPLLACSTERRIALC
jgi:hypothetical protein